jgi:hypothetical protein
VTEKTESHVHLPVDDAERALRAASEDVPSTVTGAAPTALDAPLTGDE